MENAGERVRRIPHTISIRSKPAFLNVVFRCRVVIFKISNISLPSNYIIPSSSWSLLIFLVPSLWDLESISIDIITCCCCTRSTQISPLLPSRSEVFKGLPYSNSTSQEVFFGNDFSSCSNNNTTWLGSSAFI
jgi:hypothetical protein